MAKFIKETNENYLQSICTPEDPNYFPPFEDQLTQKEVSIMFRRTVQTICSWTTKGKIPFYRVGRLPIYSRKQLIQYAAQNQHLINHNK